MDVASLQNLVEESQDFMKKWSIANGETLLLLASIAGGDTQFYVMTAAYMRCSMARMSTDPHASEVYPSLTERGTQPFAGNSWNLGQPSTRNWYANTITPVSDVAAGITFW